MNLKEAAGFPDVSEEPLSHAGAMFCSRTLVFPAENRAEFQPSPKFRRFWRVFQVLGVILGLLALASLLGGLDVWPMTLFFLICGLAMGIPGWRGVKGVLGPKPVCFDRAMGYAFFGAAEVLRKLPSAGLPLKNIAALQILQYDLRPGTRNTYFVFELNLVLHDPPGARRYVVGHGDYLALRKDADQLAAFLGVPILDRKMEQLKASVAS